MTIFTLNLQQYYGDISAFLQSESQVHKRCFFHITIYHWLVMRQRLQKSTDSNRPSKLWDKIRLQILGENCHLVLLHDI